MTSILLTAPAIEPVSLSEAKAFLRVETDEEDPLIAALIASARQYIETQTRLALIVQSWRLVLDSWPACGRVDVRPGPLRSVAAARVFDFEGNPHEVDLQALVPDFGASALAFIPWSVPLPARIGAGLEIDVICGYGDTEADVPDPLRQAIRLLTAHWFENRGLIASDAAAVVLPASAASLIAPYRLVSL